MWDRPSVHLDGFWPPGQRRWENKFPRSGKRFPRSWSCISAPKTAAPGSLLPVQGFQSHWKQHNNVMCQMSPSFAISIIPTLWIYKHTPASAKRKGNQERGPPGGPQLPSTGGGANCVEPIPRRWFPSHCWFSCFLSSILGRWVISYSHNYFLISFDWFAALVDVVPTCAEPMRFRVMHEVMSTLIMSTHRLQLLDMTIVSLIGPQQSITSLFSGSSGSINLWLNPNNNWLSVTASESGWNSNAHQLQGKYWRERLANTPTPWWLQPEPDTGATSSNRVGSMLPAPSYNSLISFIELQNFFLMERPALPAPR